MAIWQFEISILPESGLKHVCGEIPAVLREYCAVSLETDFEELPKHNYWEGFDIFQDVLPEAKVILGNEYSRTADEVKLGSRDGNRFILWANDVVFDFDLREPDLEVLESVLRLARKLNCKLVVGNEGNVIDPDMLCILEAVKKSNAYKFVKNPKQWLTQIASKYNC